MTRSTITSKSQTPTPKEVREKLEVGPRNVLQREVVEQEVREKPAHRAFLRRRGSISVGSGSVTDDVRKARELRGLASK